MRKYRITWLYKFITVIREGTCRDWCLVLDMVYKEHQEGGLSWWEVIPLSHTGKREEAKGVFPWCMLFSFSAPPPPLILLFPVTQCFSPKNNTNLTYSHAYSFYSWKWCDIIIHNFWKKVWRVLFSSSLLCPHPGFLFPLQLRKLK